MRARVYGAEGQLAAIGVADLWPVELRLAVSLCLNTSTPTAIYWGPELRLIYNDAWAPIAGEKHPWALGRPAREVWADIWDVIEPQLAKVMATGEAFTVEDQLLPMRRGGRIQQTHWDYSFAPIWNERSGTVAGIFNQGNETTARLAAERALRASEQRLEYALGASDGIGTWDWDVPNDIVKSDARFAALYGIDARRAENGAPIAEFMRRIHPDDLARTQHIINHSLATGDKINIEYRLIQADGSLRWVAAQGRCTLAPDGTPLRFPGVSFDITARKEAEAALRESEERFRGITDSIDQMIWSTQPDGNHDYYNQRWYDFTGVPVGSTDGDGWNEMFHPDDQDRAWAVWRHSLETGAPYHIEYRLRHHSGQYRWVLGRAQPVRDPEGTITRWFGTCTDIQDIVDAREVLSQSRESLEREVARRTDELMRAEERLRQAQKMEAMGQLSGGIAHDFNNMLAVVLGSLSLLERRRAQGETDIDRYVEAAKDGANRAANLTQRLLAFSRKQPLEPSSVEASALVEGMVELLSRTIGETIRVQTSTAASSWCVHADPGQLENAILNLVVNARDAMPDGGAIRLEVRDRSAGLEDAGSEETLAQDHVEILVADEGTGMDEEVLARAFEPFFTTKGVGHGTGLGLSQVFGFVQQSGGHVKIASEPGRGSEVRIFLPRHDSAPAAAATTKTGSASRPGNGETVLVVEDDDRVRAFSLEAFRELGYRTVAANSGTEGLRRLDQHPEISVLFTDMVMPGIGGRELAAAARQRRPDLKILFTTGYDKELFDTPALDRDDALILTKPFDMERLAAFMQRLMTAVA